jgi:error-prone DNA polymerase
MGFYSVAQIVQDAKNHGVEVRPICINQSRWDCTMEPIGNNGRFAVRLGMRLVKGLPLKDAARIVLSRADQQFESADDMWRRSGVPTASLVKLAEADAFLPSLKLERRQALWDIKALRDEPLELWAAAAEREAKIIAEMQEPDVTLKSMTQGREVVEDYSHTGLTLRQHPVSFLRRELRKKRIVTCAEAMAERDGRWLWTAGLVLVRQKPGSAKGVMFLTLEDETGVVNAVIWPSLFEKQRRIVMAASMMGIHGKIQREGDVVHLVAQRLFDFSGDLASLGERDGEFPLPHGRGDEAVRGSTADPRDTPKPIALPPSDILVPDRNIDTLRVKSRNFH